MKMKRSFFQLLVFLAAFSLLLSLVANSSFAFSSRRLKRDAKEVERIKRFEDSVRRDGDTLYLKSALGEDIHLKNSPGCEGSGACTSYIFLNHFDDVGFYLVKVYDWGEIEYIMISGDTAEQYQIHERPLFSPDKRRIVTIPDDTNRGYIENGIFIWLIDGDKITLEFSFDPEKIATYRTVKWKGDKDIELTKWVITSGGPCHERSSLVVDVDLNLEPDGWKMHENFTPGSPKCVDDWYSGSI